MKLAPLASLVLALFVFVPVANADLLYLPPQNLTWNQTSDSTVELAWEAPLDADETTTYNVYRDGDLLGNTVATSFVGNFTGVAVFRVTAVHFTSSSTSFQSTTPAPLARVESAPAWAIAGILSCSPILISTWDHYPWVGYSVNTACLS